MREPPTRSGLHATRPNFCNGTIQTALDRAQAAVLLLSADFFASDFNETELPPLLARAQENGVRILPVILSASRSAQDPSMARFQAVNSPDRPLNTMPEEEQEEVLQYIAERITEWRQLPPFPQYKRRHPTVTEEATDGSGKATVKVCFDEDASLLRLQALLANCDRRLYTRFVDLSSETLRLTTSLGSHDLQPDKLVLILRFLANEFGLNITVAGGGAGCTTIILNISAPDDGYIDPDKILDDTRFHAILESAGIEFVSYATIDRHDGIYRHKIGTFIYATDRTHSVSGGAVQYGTEYSPSMEFGTIEVTMPGAGRPSQSTDFFSVMWRRTKSVFASLFPGHIILTHVNPFIDNNECVEYLKKHFKGPWAVLVYVHGFNTSFEESAVQLATFSDMCALHNGTIIPILFSWPSQADFKRYTHDVAMAARCVPHFLEALKLFVPSHQTHILAHSHGASLVIQSISSASNHLPDIRKPPLGEIILVAPDVDMIAFANNTQFIEGNCARTTVYVSSDDVALALSQALWGPSRLGSSMGPMARKVDLVDVAKARYNDVVGHSHHLACPEVRYDIAGVLKGVPANGRGSWIRRRGAGARNHFEIVGR